MNPPARGWLGRVPTSDPFERRTAIAVQLFCIGLSAMLIASEAIRSARTPGFASASAVFGVLADLLSVALSVTAIVLIRRGRTRTGYAVALGGYVTILSLSLVVRGLEYHQLLLVRVFAILLVFAALVLGRRALWSTLGVMLGAMAIGALRDHGQLGGHGPLPPPTPPLGIWGQAIAVMLLLCVVLDRFGAALAEAYTAALTRQRESERVLHELRVAKESLESEMGRRVTAEALLFQSQKLEGIGRLSGGVAHDFNNLLTAILGFAHLSHDSLAESDPRRKHLDGIARAAERGAELTHQLLAFARRQIVQPRAIVMEERVREVEPMLRRLIGEHVRIELALAADPRPVLIDPLQFEQVLINLAVNARDAMPRGGTLRIASERCVVGPPAAEVVLGLEPGEHARLVVSDNGEGMDAATLANVFEPFFTTKELGKGTGLGLATCYGIIRQAGGTITVRSTPGDGARFEILLPIAATAAEVAPVRESQGRANGAEAILVVEDDPLVLDLVARVLRDRGHSVLTASDPAAAEALVRGHAGRLDLLLTDVVLPGGDGRKLAATLTRLRPGLVTLYMSGYSDEVIARHGVLEPGLALISKPFTPEALAERIDQVLAGAIPRG